MFEQVLNVVRSKANFGLPLFCLAAVTANQSVFRLGAMSPLWPIALALAIGALAWFAPDFMMPEKRARDRLHVINVLIGLVALAPLLTDFAIGWRREFPFSGDSWFHVGQSYRMAFWWLSPVASAVVKAPTLDDVRGLLARPLLLMTSRVVVLAIIGVVAAMIYRRQRGAALAFAVVVVLVWGCAEATIFLRYPGARYLVDLPFLGPAFALNDLELAGRLSNMSAALCWLFLLRPWLVGRWPDLQILPVALLLLWQKDVIYYFDSVYLEPWGVVFSLLAVEVLFEKGREAAPLACLLIGAAATVKEPFVLALPLMWLAGAPWRATRREFIRLSAAAAAAGIPFLLYYAARKNIPLADMESNRGVHFAVSMQGLERYAAEFAKQMSIAFPATSGVLAVAALAAAVLMLWWARPGRRLAFACVLAAACLIAAVFVFDINSQRWAGYFRFLLYSLPFLICGVMLLAQKLQPHWALALSAAVALLQAPSAYSALARSAGPPSGRNFVEHYDSPLVFPLRSLTSEARRAGVLRQGAPITANSIDNTLRAFPGSGITYGPVGELYCKCEPAHPNVLALFIRFTNMSDFLTDRAYPPDSRFGIWQITDARRQACLATLKQSCGHVFSRVEAGELVGALGTLK
jgi:hypothetical protein